LDLYPDCRRAAQQGDQRRNESQPRTYVDEDVVGAQIGLLDDLENDPGRSGLVGNRLGQGLGGIVVEQAVRAQDSSNQSVEVVVVKIAIRLVL
jgi:hypothetical protein